MGKVERSFELDADLVRELDAAGVDLQAEVEASLRLRLERDPGGAEERAQRWREENREALAARRDRIERSGVFGQDLRRW